MSGKSAGVTALIRASSDRDSEALGKLVEAVYPELRRIALGYMKRERADHTLQCTGLINEAYLRLARTSAREWKDRAQFFGIASQVMREILVDYARARSTAKRGGGVMTITLCDVPSAPASAVEVLDLHEALEQLEKVHPGQGRVLELRYFGGLSIEEAAKVMEVSPSTVKREWIIAKTWIHRRLLGAEPSP
ncbi:MAG TPA: sigma-70 family RNA polymerase sigma factor [Bryobacteraceae bacterium]|nr:sigma-70 family RNA polymerase sigma factor [Bryobacteraceae bacterium]